MYIDQTELFLTCIIYSAPRLFFPTQSKLRYLDFFCPCLCCVKSHTSPHSSPWFGTLPVPTRAAKNRMLLSIITLAGGESSKYSALVIYSAQST